MASLESNSYTRVTLALDIVRRLPDGPRAGFHELAAVKHLVDLHDTVRVSECSRTCVRCDDPAVPCDESNVCVRAVRLLQERFSIDRQVDIEIEKRIPVMGGLAGGSANAATTLAMVCRLWNLRVRRKRLMALARELGMDVPYYFVGGSAFDREAEGEPERIDSSLELDFVLVVPTFGVSTREAYAAIDYAETGRHRSATEAMCRALARADAAAVAANAHNDFEHSVFRRIPALRRLSGRLRACGCGAAWMSGSGSTLVGLVDSAQAGHAVAQTLAGEQDVAKVIVSRTRLGAAVA